MYQFLKIWVRLAMPFFARRLHVTGLEHAPASGPVLLAVNHPNSFVDAVLVGITLQRPVHFITRGDVFANDLVRGIFKRLNMIPIFRIRDGKEKLSLNELAFTKSHEVLAQRQQLLVFVEGFCAHQTELQLPLKKGAPRILHTCWMEGIPVQVLPIWLQYSDFRRIGKTIHVHIGQAFGSEVVSNLEEEARCHTQVNKHTADALQRLHATANFAHQRPVGWRKFLLMLPALAGGMLHAPLYLPVAALAARINGKDVHHDGLVLGLLLVGYPVYLLLLGSLAWWLTGLWWAAPASVALLLLLARCQVLWKK